MTTKAEPKPRKPKKCGHCGIEFTPAKPLQRACGLGCAVAIAQASRATKERKAQRADTKARKDKLKTRSDWIKETQREVNAYVRERDAGLPCICCGRFPANGDDVNAWDAGHYRSVGSAPHLRFDADRNIHRQLKQCNRYGAGRAVDYRIGLIARIGLVAVEDLEADHSTQHYSIEDLKQIKADYAARTRKLKKERGA
jgi:hypothetical protein